MSVYIVFYSLFYFFSDLVAGQKKKKKKEKNQTLQSEQPKDCSSGGTTHRLFQVSVPDPKTLKVIK